MSTAPSSAPASVPAWGVHSPAGWRRAWLGLLHAIPAGSAFRRLAIWLRKPLKTAFGPWVDLTVWGLRLRVRSQGNLSEQRLLLMPQFLDTTERLALADALRGGGNFLDIGANAGVYSLWVASLRAPGLRVDAFEPDPELCASLRFNLATNALDSVRLHSLALGASECEVVLAAGAGNKGENHITTAAEANPSSAAAGIRVPMTTLPAFLAREKLARIDALKIDVEGHEVSVLAPLFAGTPRSTWPRLLICELTHDRESRLAALLAENGYTLAARGRLNGIYRLAAVA
jgi:FkbM family methyltransferase